jgi:fucose permease
MKKKNYLIVLMIMVTFFVISFLTNILGSINPSVSKSFNLSQTLAGFLPFAFFIAYGVMSIPAGFMVEKFGEKKMMLFAFLLAFIGSVLFAVIPDFKIFLISLFTIGTGMAILQVVINPLLRAAGGEEHYAFNSVLAQLIFGAASFVAPLVYSNIVVGMEKNEGFMNDLFSELTTKGLEWVAIYWIFAALTVLMLVFIIIVKFLKVELKDDEKTGTVGSYIELFKNKTVILYFFGIFAYVGTEQGISYWMSKFLQEYHGYDFKTVGAEAVGNFWGLMTIGGILGLFLLKIMDSKLVLKIFTILAIISFAMALFADPKLSLKSFQFSGFFLSVMYPIIFSLALNSVNKHHGSFAGILVTGIMGGAVVQLLIGFISDLVSLKVGMGFVFVTLAYILSIGFWSKPLINNATIKMKRGSKNEA